MVLTKEERVVLQKQFGDGYLCKSLQDIALKRHKSESIGCLIGDDIINEGILKKAWNNVSSTLREFYNIALDTVKGIAWRAIVTVGNIPEFFQSLILYLERILMASGKRLFDLLSKITRYIGDLWEYISNIFLKSDIEFTTEQKEALSVSQTESFNFFSLAQSTGNIFKVIIRKLASGILTVLYGIKDIILNATKYMTLNLYNLLDGMYEHSITNDDEETKEHVVNTGLILWISNMNVINLTVAKKKFVEAFGRKLSKITNITQRKASSLTIKLIEPFITKGWLYKTYEVVKNSVSWLITYLSWLTNTLLRLRDTAFTVFSTLIFTSPFFGKVYGQWMDKSIAKVYEDSKLSNDFNELVKTISKLSKNRDVPGNIRKDLKKNIEVVDFVVGEMNEYVTENSSSKINASDKEFYSPIDKSAKVLTDLYMKRDPDSGDFNDIIRENIGYDYGTYITIIEKLNSLLNINFLRATTAIDDTRKDRLLITSDINIGNNDKGKGEEEDLSKKRLDELRQMEANAKERFEIANQALKEAEVAYNIKRNAIYQSNILEYGKKRKILLKMEQEQGIISHRYLKKHLVDMQASASLELVLSDTPDLKKIVDSFYDAGDRLNKIREALGKKKRSLKNYHYILTGVIFGVLGYGAYTYFSNIGFVPGTDAFYARFGEVEAAVDPSNLSWVSSLWNYSKPAATVTGMIGPTIAEAFDPTKWISLLTGQELLEIPKLLPMFTIARGYLSIATIGFSVLHAFSSMVSWTVVEGVYDQRGADSFKEQIGLLYQKAKYGVKQIILEGFGMAFGILSHKYNKAQKVVEAGLGIAASTLGGPVAVFYALPKLFGIMTPDIEFIKRLATMEIEKVEKKKIKYKNTDVITKALKEAPIQVYENTAESIIFLANQRRDKQLEYKKGKKEEEEEEELDLSKIVIIE